MVEQLLQLVTSGGVRAPHYFNGRLLAAGDLRQERDAGRELLARIARAVGAGVAFGFEVTAAADRRAVRVRAGLALGPYGDPLQLNDDIDLNVIAPAPPPPAPVPGSSGFRPCQPPPAGTTQVTNPGLHLLAVGPASGSAGGVPSSTLGESAAACSLKEEVSGLRFVLRPFRRALEVEVRNGASAAGDAGTRALFRSRAALACFGPGPTFPPAPGLLTNPLPAFGAISTVTEPALPACHVPLALLNIAGGGVEFIDMWAARRGLAPPGAAGPWGPLFAGRARTEAEAMTLAFQDQIEELVRAGPDPQLIAAEDWFAWLPPVGVVPVSAGNFVGLDFQQFFRALTPRKPTFVAAGQVPALYDEALRCPPTPLGGKGKPLVWLYRVRENMQAIALNPPNPPRPVMLFASGFARFLGEGRYDVSQWDFANLA